MLQFYYYKINAISVAQDWYLSHVLLRNKTIITCFIVPTEPMNSHCLVQSPECYL